MKHGRRLLSGLSLSIASLMAQSQGWAAQSSESSHLISVGAGISAPSVTSALGENPAGLARNQQTKLLGAIASENDDFDPIGYGGSLFLGNGSVGAGFGIQNHTGASNGSTLNFGLGASAQSLSIGATASRGIGDGAGGGVGFDVGMLYDMGGATVGVAAFGLDGGIDSYGAGVAFGFGSNALIAIDASTNTDFEGIRVKPALGINLSNVQLSYGYGIEVDNKGGSFIRSGSAVGIGIELNQTFHLQAYYNQIAQYYAGLTIRF